MPTKYARLNIVRDPGLEAKIDGLSGYAEVHDIKRESDLVRAMIDAGYDALRNAELRDAVSRNIAIEEEDIGSGAAQALVDEGLLE